MPEDKQKGILYFSTGPENFTLSFDSQGDFRPWSLNEEGYYQYLSEDGGAAYAVTRNDGPAIKVDAKEWYVLDGRAHRIGGPAFSDGTGYKEWSVFGVTLSEEEFENNLEFIKSATSYIEKNKVVLSEFEATPDSTGVCDSFKNKEIFLEAAAANRLNISSGPRDLRKTRQVNLDGSSFSTGLLAISALATFGLAAKAISTSKALTKKAPKEKGIQVSA